MLHLKVSLVCPIWSDQFDYVLPTTIVGTLPLFTARFNKVVFYYNVFLHTLFFGVGNLTDGWVAFWLWLFLAYLLLLLQQMINCYYLAFTGSKKRLQQVSPNWDPLLQKMLDKTCSYALSSITEPCFFRHLQG